MILLITDVQQYARCVVQKELTVDSIAAYPYYLKKKIGENHPIV